MVWEGDMRRWFFYVAAGGVILMGLLLGMVIVLSIIFQTIKGGGKIPDDTLKILAILGPALGAAAVPIFNQWAQTLFEKDNDNAHKKRKKRKRA